MPASCWLVAASWSAESSDSSDLHLGERKGRSHLAPPLSLAVREGYFGTLAAFFQLWPSEAAYSPHKRPDFAFPKDSRTLPYTHLRIPTWINYETSFINEHGGLDFVVSGRNS